MRPQWLCLYLAAAFSCVNVPVTTAAEATAITEDAPLCRYRTSRRLRTFLLRSVREVSGKVFQAEHKYFLELARELENCSRFIARHGMEKDFANLRAYVQARANPGLMLEESKEATQRYIEAMPEFARLPHPLFMSFPRNEWPQVIRRLNLPLVEKYEFRDVEPRRVTLYETDAYSQFTLFNEYFLGLITVQKNVKTAPR